MVMALCLLVSECWLLVALALELATRADKAFYSW